MSDHQARTHARPSALPSHPRLHLGANGFDEREIGDRWVIRTHISGLTIERDLDVVLGDRTLLVDGSRSRHSPKLHQVFSVPGGLSAADVKVTYVDGLLTISMPLSPGRRSIAGTWT